jgi:nucleotide-binding universal stress UspA family protein
MSTRRGCGPEPIEGETALANTGVVLADLMIDSEQRTQGATSMSAQSSPTASPQRFESKPPAVVVGYDGSAHARRALEVAAERAQPGGKVVVVYAVSPASESLDSSLHANLVAARMRREDEIVGELADVELGNVRLEVELVDGPAPAALIREARNHDADEIVVGSRGLGAIRATLGSVSHELLRHADRPVLVVPPHAADADGTSDNDH